MRLLYARRSIGSEPERATDAKPVAVKPGDGHEDSTTGSGHLTGDSHLDFGSQARTTASDGHSCERCHRPLTGRKRRFCSDACRMRYRRVGERERRSKLFGQIESRLNDDEREQLKELLK